MSTTFSLFNPSFNPISDKKAIRFGSGKPSNPGDFRYLLSHDDSTPTAPASDSFTRQVTTVPPAVTASPTQASSPNPFQKKGSNSPSPAPLPHFKPEVLQTQELQVPEVQKHGKRKLASLYSEDEDGGGVSSVGKSREAHAKTPKTKVKSDSSGLSPVRTEVAPKGVARKKIKIASSSAADMTTSTPKPHQKTGLSQKRDAMPEKGADKVPTTITPSSSTVPAKALPKKGIAQNKSTASRAGMATTSALRKEYESFIDAVSNGRQGEVKAALLKNPNFLNQRGEHQLTPLMVAASENEHKMVRLLLNESGIRPNLQDDGGFTAIMWPEATHKGYVETIQVFMAHLKEHPDSINLNRLDKQRINASTHLFRNSNIPKLSKERKVLKEIHAEMERIEEEQYLAQ